MVWDNQSYQKRLPESQSVRGCFEIGAPGAPGLGTKTQSPSENAGVKSILTAIILLIIPGLSKTIGTVLGRLYSWFPRRMDPRHVVCHLPWLLFCPKQV